MIKASKAKGYGAGKSSKNQSFSAQLHKMHPNEVGALLMRIDAKISSDAYFDLESNEQQYLIEFLKSFK